MRRTLGWLAATAGVFLLAVPFALSLFGRTAAGERVTDNFRPLFEPANVKQTRSGFNVLVAAGVDLNEKALPGIAQALSMSPPQLSAFLQQNFPDVATGAQQLPAITKGFDGLLTKVEANEKNFHSADMIPISALPITSVPWIYIGIGTAFIVAGGLTIRGANGRRRAGLVAVAAISAIAILLPVGASFFSKVDAADALTTDLATSMSPAGVQQFRSGLGVVERMANELSGKLLPALSKTMAITPEQLNQFLAKNFPDLAAGVAQLPALLDKFNGIVTTMERSVADFKKTSEIPFPVLPWLMFVPGVVIALGAAASLLVRPALLLDRESALA